MNDMVYLMVRDHLRWPEVSIEVVGTMTVTVTVIDQLMKLDEPARSPQSIT